MTRHITRVVPCSWFPLLRVGRRDDRVQIRQRLRLRRVEFEFDSAGGGTRTPQSRWQASAPNERRRCRRRQDSACRTRTRCGAARRAGSRTGTARRRRSASAAKRKPAARRGAAATEEGSSGGGSSNEQRRTGSAPQTQQGVLSGLEQWLRANRNKNTAATYASAWRQFARWATEVANPQRAAAAHVDLQPPSEADVALYMRHIVTVKGGTMQSVGSALAGIADHFRYTDHNPCRGEFITQMRLVLTPLATPAGQKKEISWELLTRAAAAAGRRGRRWASATAR